MIHCQAVNTASLHTGCSFLLPDAIQFLMHNIFTAAMHFDGRRHFATYRYHFILLFDGAKPGPYLTSI